MEHVTFDYTSSFSNFEHIRIALPLSNVLQDTPACLPLKVDIPYDLTPILDHLVFWSVRVYTENDAQTLGMSPIYHPPCQVQSCPQLPLHYLDHSTLAKRQLQVMQQKRGILHSCWLSLIDGSACAYQSVQSWEFRRF